MVDIVFLLFLVSFFVMGTISFFASVVGFFVIIGIVTIELAVLSKAFCVIGALSTIPLLILIGIKIRRR